MLGGSVFARCLVMAFFFFFFTGNEQNFDKICVLCIFSSEKLHKYSTMQFTVGEILMFHREVGFLFIKTFLNPPVTI